MASIRSPTRRRITGPATIRNNASPNERSATPLTRLSLCALPLEILEQVINYVALYVSEEEERLASDRTAQASVVPVGGHQSSYINFLHDNNPILNSLQSLGAVSQMFYQLCRPTLWRKCHFPTRVSIPIDYYITDIFPKHGSFVKDLTIRLSPECCLGPGRRPSTRQRAAKHVYDNTIKTRMPPIPAVAGPNPLRLVAKCIRQPLSAENAFQLVLLCPNLRSLSINLPEIENNKHAARSQRNLEGVLLSLVSHVKGLEELEIYNPSYMPDRCMSKVIRRLPLLKSLSLSNLVSSPRTKITDSFGWNLARLRHLTRIHLFQVNSAHESWCDYPWPKTIKQLRLKGHATLSPMATRRLIQAMAPDVVRLGLGCGFGTGNAVVNEEDRASRFDFQYDLPRLTDLTLDVNAPSYLTRCFQGCKNLRRLKHNRATIADWDVFTELVPQQTWPLLKRIDVRKTRVDIIVSPGFEELCDQAGIELMLKGSPRPLSSDWDYHYDEVVEALTQEEQEQAFQVPGMQGASIMMVFHLYFEEHPLPTDV